MIWQVSVFTFRQAFVVTRVPRLGCQAS
jgi:hypothetical protein